MKTILYASAALCCLASAGLAQAPQITPAPTVIMTSAPTPIPSIVTTNAVLRVGTEVPVRLLEELTTQGKKLRVGNRFRMETSEPVMVQGVVVIPVGSPVVGEITDVRNKGMWGKSGHLGARILYVTVNGRQIRMSGAFDDKGVAGGVGAVAVSAIVFLPAGFFMTGTSARVPVGTIIKGFVDEDVQLALQSAAPPPLVVSAPSPATTQAAPAQSTPPIGAGVTVATPGTKLH
ncbi:MAG: hypothetical protein ACJ8FC_02895 [Sphingomicrobium sp.]